MKTTITVEMTDEEYQEYKKFLSGIYIDKSELDLVKALEILGYTQTNIEEKFDIKSHRLLAHIEYKGKANDTISINGWSSK